MSNEVRKLKHHIRSLGGTVPFSVNYPCWECGSNISVIDRGYSNWLRCRDCNKHHKLISKSAVEFFIICSIALRHGIELKEIRNALGERVYGPLAVAFNLICPGFAKAERPPSETPLFPDEAQP